MYVSLSTSPRRNDSHLKRSEAHDEYVSRPLRHAISPIRQGQDRWKRRETVSAIVPEWPYHAYTQAPRANQAGTLEAKHPACRVAGWLAGFHCREAFCNRGVQNCTATGVNVLPTYPSIKDTLFFDPRSRLLHPPTPPRRSQPIK